MIKPVREGIGLYVGSSLPSPIIKVTTRVYRIYLQLLVLRNYLGSYNSVHIVLLF